MWRAQPVAGPGTARAAGMRTSRCDEQRDRLRRSTATSACTWRPARDGTASIPVGPTPHLPHGWDAGMLFEEQDRVLFCSDLFHQLGKREPVTTGDVVGRYAEAIAMMQAH